MNKNEENPQNSNEKPEIIKWFNELNKDSSEIAGEKGANIAELYNLKMPVQPGFIITTQAYEYFLENVPELKIKISGMLKKINYENTALLNDISGVIMNSITESDIPKHMEEEILEAYDNLGASDLSEAYGSALDILQNAQEPIFVAVRSSSPKGSTNKEGLAAQQDSFLNIKGEKELLFHVKKCFASLFTPNEIYSRYKEGIKDTPLTIAIIVQKMVDSSKSGVIFSKNPENKEELFIHAIWGLGEGAASKIIPPDEYIITKELEIKEVKVANKEIAITRDSSGNKISVKLREEKSKQQVLVKREILKLSELALEIEKHYNKPQCIEFAIEGNDIYLLQTQTMKLAPLKTEEIIEEVQKFEDKRQLEEKAQIERLEKTTPSEKLEEKSLDTKLEKTQNKEIEPITAKTKTKIKLMIDSQDKAEKSSKTNLKYIGLLKLEKIIEDSGKHPKYYLENNQLNEYEKLIFNNINSIAEKFNELWVKIPSLRTDKYSRLEGSPKNKENNPLLGMHGIQFSLKNPQIFKSELNALKEVNEKSRNIKILLPRVIQIEEVIQVKEILKEIGFEDVPIGVIIETPASVQIINQLCDERINLILINLENLTQYILSIDKENEEVKQLFNETHPAILYQLAYMLRICKRKNIQTNICINKKIQKGLIKFVIENNIDSITLDLDIANEVTEYVKAVEEEIVKGTDEEPRKYVPEKDKLEDNQQINGVEKLQNLKEP